MHNTRRLHSTIKRPDVHKWIVIQVSVVLLMSLVGWMINPLWGKSLLLGGLVAVVPSAYFAWSAFKYTGASQGARVLQSFYRGEAWNFLLTAVGFSLVFIKAQPINAYAVFGAYAVMKFSHVFVVKLVRL